MSLQNLFRVGKPRITETTDNFGCGRSTGGMGTGIYAYKDLDAAEENSSYKSGKQSIYELENICKNPIVSTTEFETLKLNDAGIAMRCEEEKEAFDKLIFVDGIMQAVDDKFSCGGKYSTQCDIKLKKIIKSSIKKERDCSRDKEGKETWGAKYCSHAMNHLLEDLEIDCVLPTNAAGGNSNTFGSIILKETIDKHLGRKTVGYKDIDDFGIKILNKLEK